MSTTEVVRKSTRGVRKTSTKKKQVEEDAFDAIVNVEVKKVNSPQPLPIVEETKKPELLDPLDDFLPEELTTTRLSFDDTFEIKDEKQTISIAVKPTVHPIVIQSVAQVDDKKSIVDFEHGDIRRIDVGDVKKLDNLTLLKILLVRGRDEHNPSLWSGATRLLKQLNCEFETPQFEQRNYRQQDGGRNFNQPRQFERSDVQPRQFNRVEGETFQPQQRRDFGNNYRGGRGGSRGGFNGSGRGGYSGQLHIQQREQQPQPHETSHEEM